jgi:sugar phosphate isomerase/epimerase
MGGGKFMIRLAAFADEADKTLEGQIAALKRNGLEYVELRGIYDKNVLDVTLEEAEKYAKILSDAGIKVWSIGSPIGKIKLDDYSDDYKEKVRHIAKLARIFGTDKIRAFSFYEAYGRDEEVFAALREMQSIAESEGACLYHENEKGIFGDTAERVLKLVENVKGMKFVYDPANFTMIGEEADKTLNALHSKTDYFHIKDVISETKQIVPAGYGDGRIDELVANLQGDAVLSVEPHLAAFDGYSQIDSTEMKHKFHFTSNEEAFDAAVTALKGLLIKSGYKENEWGYERL